jgi:DNA-binding transcriptional LysR family regulator
MDRLETRQFAYFVAVAEELHFGRAAERLGIAAPPLSRAIARLERKVGARLFDRTSRRVELTAAGEVFLVESRAALEAVDAALRKVRRAGRALVVAVRSGSGAGVLPEVMAAYGGAVEVVFTADQVGALRDGTADVGLLCGSSDLVGLSTVEVMRERPVALVPVGHRVAGLAGVSVAELRREQVFAEKCPPVALDELVDRVAMGRLIVVAGHGAVGRLGDAVVGVPVVDLPSTALVLAWKRRDALVSGFVRVASDVVARRGSRAVS